MTERTCRNCNHWDCVWLDWADCTIDWQSEISITGPHKPRIVTFKNCTCARHDPRIKEVDPDTAEEAAGALESLSKERDELRGKLATAEARAEKAEAVMSKVFDLLGRRMCDLKDRLARYPADTYSDMALEEARQLCTNCRTAINAAGVGIRAQTATHPRGRMICRACRQEQQ